MVAGVAMGTASWSSAPAAAHTCGDEPTIEAGVNSEIEVGVTAGDQPATSFAVGFDDTFRVVEVEPRAGWKAELGPNTIDFTGGNLEASSCTLFAVTVNASAAGTYRIRVLQQLEDGRVVEYPPEGDVFQQPDGSSVRVDRSGPPNSVFEQVVVVTPADDDGPNVALLVGFVAAVALALVWLWPRRSRGRQPRRRR